MTQPRPTRRQTANNRTARLRRRNRDIRRRLGELYERERIRLDDCIARIADEFYLSEATVERILTSAVPDDEADEPNGT